MNKNLLTNSELSIFCYQLSLVFKSGIPLDEAMSIFIDEMSSPALKKIANQLKQDLDMGQSITESLKNMDNLPKYMVGMIEIAYNTGSLEDELERLSDYYQEIQRLNQKISNAVTYPLILSSLMFMVIAFLVIKVIPMFNDILSNIGAKVPKGTQMLLNAGLTLKNYGIFILIFIILFIGLGYFYTKNSSDKWKYNLAFIGNINKKILCEKFALAMSMLMKGGYSFDDALEVYINSIDSKYASLKLKQAQENIINGADVSQEMNNLKLFPALFTKMMSIGYKTGELEASLTKIAGIYKMEVEKTIDKVTSSIEPALVIFLSLIVGIILLSVMTPLISIISAL